jgi:regulation of enolase protein 1 (concanavalin A-like superfamily)
LDFTTGELTGDAYKRGLINKISYLKTDGSPVKDEIFNYLYVDGPEVIGNRVAKVGADHYFIDAYYLRTGKSFLQEKKVVLYENASNSIQVQTNLTNNTVYEQLRTSAIVNSNTDVLKTTYIYPNDIYSGGIHGCEPEACGLNQLFTNHRLAIPMEITEAKNNQLIKASLTSYKTQDNSSNGVAVPYREYTIESNTPFSKDNTTITHNSSTGLYEFTFDSKYKLKAEYVYDQYGNVINYQSTDDLSCSFYYGYASTLPVIEGKNITYSELNAAVATVVTTLHVNFEAFLTGLGDLTDQSKIDSWKYFNSLLRAALPQDARIVTYTYVPMVGVTSKTDENNIATYFLYDKLGRLIFEKDCNGDILKKYAYHYGSQ